ncbi:MAG: hypothetical protein ABIA04_00900 [Pseudomonadota bacterium]
MKSIIISACLFFMFGSFSADSFELDNCAFDPKEPFKIASDDIRSYINKYYRDFAEYINYPIKYKLPYQVGLGAFFLPISDWEGRLAEIGKDEAISRLPSEYKAYNPALCTIAHSEAELGSLVVINLLDKKIEDTLGKEEPVQFLSAIAIVTERLKDDQGLSVARLSLAVQEALNVKGDASPHIALTFYQENPQEE